MFRLKETAPSNIRSNATTFETSHASIKPLNVDAPLNMFVIFTTPLTSHPFNDWLNLTQPSNMEAASVKPFGIWFGTLTSSVLPAKATTGNVTSPHCLTSVNALPATNCKFRIGVSTHRVTSR